MLVYPRRDSRPATLPEDPHMNYYQYRPQKGHRDYVMALLTPCVGSMPFGFARNMVQQLTS